MDENYNNEPFDEKKFFKYSVLFKLLTHFSWTKKFLFVNIMNVFLNQG